MKQFFSVLSITVALIACTNTPGKNQTAKINKPAAVKPAAVTSVASAHVTNTVNIMADAATILSRKQAPVLCYHHIEDWKPNEKSSLKLLLVPINNFKDQIKSLADS